VKNEEANFNFTADHRIFVPYMWDYRDGKISIRHLKLSIEKSKSQNLPVIR